MYVIEELVAGESKYCIVTFVPWLVLKPPRAMPKFTPLPEAAVERPIAVPFLTKLNAAVVDAVLTPKKPVNTNKNLLDDEFGVMVKVKPVSVIEFVLVLVVVVNWYCWICKIDPD